MFDQQRLKVNDCTIRLRRAGAGTTLLYLHGANGVPQVPAFLAAFRSDFDVVVPEHPGFGESDDPAWLECMDDLAYFYLDFLDQLKLQKLHVIGSSLGGWLALELAIRQPDRFQSLLLIGSAGITLPQVPPGDSFRWTAAEAARHTFHGDAWVEGALALPPDAATAAKNRHTVTRLAWSPRFHHPMLHKRLHRVRMPVLLAWGENDRIIPVEYGSQLLRLLPNAKLTRYTECGHLPQVERQQAFTRDALQFLKHPGLNSRDPETNSMLAGQIINGIVSGAMYALVAIGFSLVIGVLDKLNFAHPEVFMFGGFIALTAMRVLPLPMAFVVVFVAGGVLGLLTEFIAFRRFRSADAKITAALASMALGLIITDLVQKWWGSEPVPVSLPAGWLQESHQVAGVSVLNLQIVILVITFVLMGSLHMLLQRTRMGRQIRALAESSVSASLLGINVKRVTQSVFFISSALAAVAGLLLALRGGAASSDIGLTFGLKALAIMAIGGLGDLRGAVVGGLLIGVLESLTFLLGLGRLVEITVWVAMIAVLMFKPGGLFGGGMHNREQRA